MELRREKQGRISRKGEKKKGKKRKWRDKNRGENCLGC